MIPIPVALQAYSFRNIYSVNPLQALKEIKAAGYDGVELYGDEFQGEYYRAILAESGLVCAGWHTRLDFLQKDFDTILRKNLAVGNHFMCIPWFDAPNVDGWKKFAEDLEAMAAKLAPYGIRTGYHTHKHDHVEIAPGVTPWDIVAQTTGKEVILQLDLGNAASAGTDAYDILTKYEGRSLSIHCKPYSQTKGFNTAIGEDDIPWEKVVKFCREKGNCFWLVVEYEEEDPVPVCKRSLEHLRKFTNP